MTCSVCGHCMACAVRGSKAAGGLGGVAMMPQIIGTLMAITIAVVGGYLVYKTLKLTMGLRLSQEEEFNGADLSVHKISATAERDTNW
jgi:ammonium transporter, Amt family